MKELCPSPYTYKRKTNFNILQFFSTLSWKNTSYYSIQKALKVLHNASHFSLDRIQRCQINFLVLKLLGIDIKTLKIMFYFENMKSGIINISAVTIWIWQISWHDLCIKKFIINSVQYIFKIRNVKQILARKKLCNTYLDPTLSTFHNRKS